MDPNRYEKYIFHCNYTPDNLLKMVGNIHSQVVDIAYACLYATARYFFGSKDWKCQQKFELKQHLAEGNNHTEGKKWSKSSNCFTW